MDDHPTTKLIRPSDIRTAVEVLGSIARHAVAMACDASVSASEAARRAAALGINLATDDMKSYFSQLPVRAKNVSRQGIALPREDGSITYSFSRRVQFGGATSPAWAMRLTTAIVHRLNIMMDAEEVRFATDAAAFEADASTGSEIAALVSPRALRDLLDERRQLGGDSQARPFWAAGYIGTVITPQSGLARPQSERPQSERHPHLLRRTTPPQRPLR